MLGGAGNCDGAGLHIGVVGLFYILMADITGRSWWKRSIMQVETGEEYGTILFTCSTLKSGETAQVKLRICGKGARVNSICSENMDGAIDVAIKI